MRSYVVVDLEMCNVPRGPMRKAFHSASELIQIGAVCIDEEYCVKDTFMTFVAPRYGVLDSFITELTGITEESLKDAPSTEDALNAFSDWLPDGAFFVAWSGSDRAQLQREIYGKDIHLPRLDAFMEKDSWIDCQALFGQRLGENRDFALSEALVIADIDFESGAHDALVDAANTARLFGKLRREEILTLSPYLIRPSAGGSYTFDPFSARR